MVDKFKEQTIKLDAKDLEIDYYKQFQFHGRSYLCRNAKYKAELTV